MSELLKKQNYGVEVEFTGISRKMAAGAVAEIIGTTASRPDHTCYQTRTIQDSQGRKWKVMRDSSIHPIRKVGTENMDEYRVEFVTPILKYEDLDTLQAIIRKFRETSPHNSVTDISLSIRVFFTSLHHGDSFRFKISPPFSTNVYYICCLHLFAIALK